MHVGDMVSRLVVAHDVLPRVALLTEDGVAVVVGEAADAFYGGRLFLVDCAVESAR